MLNDYSVYLVNYRGYAGNSGKPTEKEIYVDALNLYDKLSSRHEEISLIGRSLGGAVATYLAVNRKIKRMALITPFDSIEKIAAKLYPIFPISIMLKDKYDAYSRVDKLTIPVLVIMAERDEIIPRENTERLITKMNSKILSVSIIPRSTHNTIDNRREFSQILSGFFNSFDTKS